MVEADLWQSAVNAYLEKHTETESASTGQAFIACGPAFERLQRIINSCERHYRNAVKELQALAAAPTESVPAPQPEESAATSESVRSFRTNAQSDLETEPKDPEIAAIGRETAPQAA